MEICQRCGIKDCDLRTLWHACFYEMNEIGLPFKEFAIRGIGQNKTGEEELGPFKTKISKFSDLKEAKENQYKFYLLRVCKNCRASWMTVLKTWFAEKFDKEQIPTGSGIYKRHLGANIED